MAGRDGAVPDLPAVLPGGGEIANEGGHAGVQRDGDRGGRDDPRGSARGDGRVDVKGMTQ
jgi:hypothetical protein